MSDHNGVWTVLVAAGSATRFGADKLNVVLQGDRTVLDFSIAHAMAASEGTVVVVSGGDPALHATAVAGLTFTEGGSTRSQSVRCGLAQVPEAAEIVLVHDAARPLADEEVFSRVVLAVRSGAAAAVPVIPVVDTIRSTDATAIDREHLRAVQTPQAFEASALRAAHASGHDATDDATLVEAVGGQVVLVDGDVRNLKITRPIDIEVARAVLAGLGSIHP